MKKIISISFLLLFWQNSFATNIDRQWSILFYGGSTVQQNLRNLITLNYTPAGETIYSTELAYVLNQNNPVIKFLHPVVDQIQFAWNIAERFDNHVPHPINEFDAYIMVRHINRLWARYVFTTVAIGEGISYVTSIPPVEENALQSKSSTRLLDFMAFEFTFSPPSYPYFQIVARIHHRSGCYGLFYPKSEHPGSNTIGLGIRYYFK
jgi:hypothetical protein